MSPSHAKEVQDIEGYFPPAESAGGWRKLTDPDKIRSLAGMDPEKLEAFTSWILAGELNTTRNGGVIIRNGWIVAEWYNETTAPETLVEIKSAAKAFAALYVGMVIDESRKGKFSANPEPKLRRIDYDSPAYDYIPDGHPLSDPRKSRITVRQLMHHVAGIVPECFGTTNFPPEGAGFWEYALGKDPGYPTAPLYADPGTRFLYGTWDIRHLSLILQGMTGQRMDEFAGQRVFAPCGIESWSMDVHGGDGRLGPFADIRLYTTARDFARLGYLMLRGGAWGGSEIFPPWLVKESLEQPFPGLVPQGFTHHWIHRAPTWPAPVPDDLFFTSGAGINFCMVVPSLDLVAVRVGNSFRADWDQSFRDIAVRIFSAVIGSPAPPADASRPAVAISSPPDGECVSGTISLRGTATDEDAVALVEVSVDGCGRWQPTEGTDSWSYAWDTTVSTDGEHRLFVRAFDTAGNASPAGFSRSFLVQNSG